MTPAPAPRPLLQLLGVACILAGLLITTRRASRRAVAEPEIG